MEEGNTEQFELPLIGDIERDSDEFVVEERLMHQQRGQLLDLLDEYVRIWYVLSCPPCRKVAMINL